MNLLRRRDPQVAKDTPRIALRMLGERRGTGDTEGVAYLERARSIPSSPAGARRAWRVDDRGVGDVELAVAR